MKRYFCIALLSGAAALSAISVASNSSAIAGGCSMNKKAAAMQNEQIEETKTDEKKVEA